jgi:hypothetical protein
LLNRIEGERYFGRIGDTEWTRRPEKFLCFISCVIVKVKYNFSIFGILFRLFFLFFLMILKSTVYNYIKK